MHARVPADAVATNSATVTYREVDSGDDVTSAIDLQVRSCAMLRHGGVATITSAELSRPFILAADREWSVVDAELGSQLDAVRTAAPAGGDGGSETVDTES